MKKIFTILAMSAFALTAAAYESHHSSPESEESQDSVRTQSGVDPTRITNRTAYSFLFYDKKGSNAQIVNRFAGNVGIRHWSFQLKADIVSLNTTSEDSFTTGVGDMKFNILNAFYTKGRNAFAGSVEFGLPTASSNIAVAAGMGGYFSATPSITWSYTINPGLMFALQPQYTFSLAKKQGYQGLSVLTIKVFLAKFWDSGLFVVLEPRPVYDFKSKDFDLVLSPILGKTLGKGFNFVVLSEIPTNNNARKSKGVLYQCGINRTF